MHWNAYVNENANEYANEWWILLTLVYFCGIQMMMMMMMIYFKFLNKLLENFILYRIIVYYTELGVYEGINRYLDHC